MARIAIQSQGIADTTIKTNFDKISSVLNGGITFDNLNGSLLSDTTSSSANTQKLFRHGMSPAPQGGFVILGNAYLYSIDNTYIDVRSAGTNQAFTILLLRGKTETLS